MTGKDLLLHLNEIDDQWIELAESETISVSPAPLSRKRLFLLAAVIILALCFLGCTIAYTLKLQDLKMGVMKTVIPAIVFDDGSSSQSAQKEFYLVSLSGIPGTPVYQAAQEWLSFTQQYDADFQIRKEFQGNFPDFGVLYNRYSIYTQEMVDTLHEILNRYDLKLMGHPIPFANSEEIQNAFPLENAAFRISSGAYYDCGNLDLMIALPVSEAGEIWGSLSYRRKEVFIGDTLPLGTSHTWAQDIVSTASGIEVLILSAPTSPSTHLLCDLGNATLTISLMTDTQWKTGDDGLSYATEWIVLSAEQLQEIISMLQPWFFDPDFWNNCSFEES